MKIRRILPIVLLLVVSLLSLSYIAMANPTSDMIVGKTSLNCCGSSGLIVGTLLVVFVFYFRKKSDEDEKEDEEKN